jgi:phospholipase/carboxylesterase
LSQSDPHRDEPILYDGRDLASAQSAFTMLHGRGGSASDILSVGRHLASEQTALLAPQAAEDSWYPYSFLVPLTQNQPWLNSAMRRIAECVAQCVKANIPSERVAIIGFSQGACLATAFAAFNPTRYGGLIAFTGALPGPLGTSLDYPGELRGTPILLSSGDPDPHVPWQRVEETEKAFTRMGAIVQATRHKGRPHTILSSELLAAKQLLTTSSVISGSAMRANP